MIGKLLDKVIKKDDLLTGVLIGILLPIFTYLLIYLTSTFGKRLMLDHVFESLQLLLIAINAIVMRYFMITRDQENIGRGILGVTFIWVIAWVVSYQL